MTGAKSRTMTTFRHRTLILVSALTVVFPYAARADEGEGSASRVEPPPAPSPVPAPAPSPAEAAARTWYGGQVLAVDGASAISLTTGIALASATGAGGSAIADVAVAGLLLGGAGTYALGAPVVHIAHGRVGAAALSLGLRIGLPTAGFFLGGFISPRCPARRHDDFDICLNGLTYGSYGALLGAVAASATDAAALAYDVEPHQKQKPKRVPTLGFAPQVDPARGSYGISLYGVGL